LGQWLEEQTSLRRDAGRYVLVLTGSLVLGLGVAPWLWGLGNSAGAGATSLSKQTKELAAQLAIADKAHKAAEPALVMSTMCDRTRASFDFLRGTIERPLRSGNPRMVLSNVRCEVAAAEAHLSVQAFAEDDSAADAFASLISEEGSKVDAITSSRPSVLLGPGGLSFQYEKRVQVPK